MQDVQDLSKDDNNLRRQAEAALRGEPVELEGLTSVDIQEILHELQVHQIELAIQNENLLQTQHELEVARNKYSDLYEYAPLGYFTLDENGFVLDANRTGLELLKTEKEPILNRPFAAFVTEEYLGIFYTHRQQVALTGKQHTCEVKLRCADKKVIDVQIESRPAMNQDPDVKHVAMALVDITVHKQIEKQLRQQDKMAAIGQLAGGVAHDFNNILLGIMATGELIRRREEASEFVSARVGRILQQADRAAKLVAQLLDFSRESASEQLQLNIHKFLEDLVPILRRTVAENVYIEFDSTLSSRGIYVRADKVQMQQIVLNLVMNASQAMEQGGKVWLILDSLDLAAGGQRPIPEMPLGKWVKIEVRDSGPGIPAAVLPHIFEPFFTTKPTGKGTGLGLSQVYGIVRKHRGHIVAKSEAGGGASLIVYLPLHEPDGKRDGEMGDESVYRGNGETILLVEDDRVVLDATKELLVSLGYDVIVANSGKRALERFSEHMREIDLVLVDMVMPEMSGPELFEALRKFDDSVKGLIISGYPLDMHKGMLEAIGLSGAITKPFSIYQLSQRVHQVLHQGQAL